MSLTSKLESLLLVAGKPMPYVTLTKLLSCSGDELKNAVAELEKQYNRKESGIHVLVNDQKVQFSTNPDNKALIADFIKDETTGELTKPSLETLTIIAYRQPVTKEELEQIRGVNCSLILRNLMIRGLVETKEERGGLATTYSVTMDFLRFLGINKVEELPEFRRLHDHESLQQALERVAEMQQ
ncbi:MAG: SMC-Scp complex subunit ScpB [Candidatus Komeilibacteria bacterium]|nr:SMC-Scp complex subunit ScpB [Candidatus Komeilibacteria bacterium]